MSEHDDGSYDEVDSTLIHLSGYHGVNKPWASKHLRLPDGDEPPEPPSPSDPAVGAAKPPRAVRTRAVGGTSSRA